MGKIGVFFSLKSKITSVYARFEEIVRRILRNDYIYSICFFFTKIKNHISILLLIVLIFPEFHPVLQSALVCVFQNLTQYKKYGWYTTPNLVKKTQKWWSIFSWFCEKSRSISHYNTVIKIKLYNFTL